MLNLNTEISSNAIYSNNNIKPQESNLAVNSNNLSLGSESSKVEIQTKLEAKEQVNSFNLNKDNALAFVNDLASALKSSGSQVQANLSSFDATALLA